jgi:glycosyltransferase involved in cell wall biosynthesis
MKVLLCHNLYQQLGGEDRTVAAEVELLRRYGHQVIEYFRHNNEIKDYGGLKKALLYFVTTWSRKSYKEVKELCRKHRPDVAHFHNTLPLISPSAYYACKEEHIPVVQTLQNYRLVCPGGKLMRDGRVCEVCLGSSLRPAFEHKCRHGSYIQTRAIVRMLEKHRRWGTYDEMVDNYIAVAEFGRRKFIEGGLPAEKIVVKPNLLATPPKPEFGGDYAVYVGRLSPEKGVHVLLEAWKQIQFPLRIAGDGPQRKELEQTESAEAEFLGQVSPGEVLSHLKKSRFMILPTLCYEGFPVTLVEAFACGKAVVASRLGSAAEIVEDGKTGLLFKPGDAQDLAAKARMLIDDPDLAEELGRNARAEFEAKYTAEKNYEQLMKIYEDVIKSSKR